MNDNFDQELKVIAEDEWLVQVANYVPSAWIGHAPFLRYLIREIRPKIFVELGTHNGFSYFSGCQAILDLCLSTKCYAVDHWFGDKHAGHFDESVYESVVELNKKYWGFSTLLRMSFLEALEIVPNQIDLLHIDGLHTYDAVKEDFESWLPKMQKDGIILMHDIHVRHGDFGVYKLWEDIKVKFETIEFTGSYGLGVIFLGSIPGSSLPNLKEYADSGNLMKIQGVFGGLSDGTIQNYRQIIENNLNFEISELKKRNEFNLEVSRLSLIAVKNQLENVLNSKSWRWTSQLRVVLESIRKLKN